jgi:hypothetical protein
VPVQDIVTALEKLSAAQDAELRNCGDIAALIRNNPLVAAFVLYLKNEVRGEMMREIQQYITPPAHELFDYPAVAKRMDKSQSAVRKMKERGQLVAVDHPVHGKTMFTEEAVDNAIAAELIRNERNRERQTQVALELTKKRTAA